MPGSLRRLQTFALCHYEDTRTGRNTLITEKKRKIQRGGKARLHVEPGPMPNAFEITARPEVEAFRADPASPFG